MTGEARSLHRGLSPPLGDWPENLPSPSRLLPSLFTFLLFPGGPWLLEGPRAAVHLVYCGPTMCQSWARHSANPAGQGQWSPITGEDTEAQGGQLTRPSHAAGPGARVWPTSKPFLPRPQGCNWSTLCVALCSLAPGLQFGVWPQEGCWLSVLPGVHSTPPSLPGSGLVAAALVENQTQGFVEGCLTH